MHFAKLSNANIYSIKEFENIVKVGRGVFAVSHADG